MQTPLLQGKTILITGAAGGIARNVALLYAKHGATLILLGRNIKTLEALSDEINQTKAVSPTLYPMNLAGAVPEHFDDLGRLISQEFGKLDGLLHNATEPFTLTPIAQTDAKAWHQLMQTNLNAPFMLTQACLKCLKAAPKASLVFTLDNLDKVSKAYFGAYGISKWGLMGLMKILADELDNSSVRVNAITPDVVDTPLYRRLYPGRQAPPKPCEILSNYLYLMSDLSQHIHGQNLKATPVVRHEAWQAS